MRILVTGGVRSGKSTHAEALIGREPATYVASGPTPDAEADPDWTARIATHRRPAPDRGRRSRRRTSPKRSGTPGAVLVDCLGTWLTAIIDTRARGAGRRHRPACVLARVDQVVAALRVRHDVVVVTNEVGLGVVPEHRSGRLFRDLLGTVNQRVAAACDEVHLVVAGRVLRL